MTKIWTVEEIKELLRTSDKMVTRSVVKLYELQTASEQAAQETHERNGVGFNGVDAPILSSFAEWYKSRGYLSTKQIALARKKLYKYSGQLVQVANGTI